MSLTSHNAVTLSSYKDYAGRYIEYTPSTVSGTFKDWMDYALSLLPSKESSIFEIGSGGGRDAACFQSQGFTNIQPSDASTTFVSHLKSHGHAHTVQFNALHDDFNKSWDLIIANAVFLHFDRHQLSQVIVKCLHALSPQGLLAFSVKAGEGEGWSREKLDAPRYFCYWQLDNLLSLIPPDMATVIYNSQDNLFIHIIVRKRMLV